jgi:hypothetical protein
MSLPRAIGVLTLALCVTLTGCRLFSSGPPKPSTGGTYDGPGFHLVDHEGFHRLVLTAPTGGWAVALDQTRETRHGFDLFVAVTRPSSQFVYPQVVVEQNLLTPVRADRPVRVFARLTPHGVKPSGSYGLVLDTYDREAIDGQGD